MKINLNISPGERIRAHYLFFIIIGIQIGVGILGAPRYIAEHAHQDSWISILIAYIGTLIITAIMFAILSRYENTDIFGIQHHIFGNFLGKFMGIVCILFFFIQLLTTLITYIEVVQIFLFPSMPTVVMTFLLLIPICYSILGGLRIVVGVVFLFSFLSFWIVVLIYDPITRMDVTHFLPMFEASLTDLLKGAKATTFTLLGFNILLYIYPFIDNKENAKKPVYLGLTFTGFVLLVSTIVSIGYFSPNDISIMSWPVLSLYKSVQFSFMERFDYIVIVEWMLVVLPTSILLMWAIVYGMERLFQVQQKASLLGSSILLLILCLFITTDLQIQKVTNFVGDIGFWFVFVYPVILFPLVLLKTKRKPLKEVQNEKDS